MTGKQLIYTRDGTIAERSGNKWLFSIVRHHFECWLSNESNIKLEVLLASNDCKLVEQKREREIERERERDK